MFSRPMIGPRSPDRPQALTGLGARVAAAGLAISVTGCAATAGPDPDRGIDAGPGGSLVHSVAPGAYEEAFDAAVSVLQDHGLSAAVRDRRTGVIETGDRIGAGWFEPWRLEPASDLEGTASLSTVRRRARVEFTPAGTDGAADLAMSDKPAAGADLFGVREPAMLNQGLSNQSGPLQMRVRVTVERAHRPGLRVDTWSRRLTTQARVGRPGPGATRADEPTVTWWPVARDPGLERALLVEMAERAADASAASD